MKKHLLAMAGATAFGKSWRPRATAIALGLATAALGTVSAGAIQLADSNVIKVQNKDQDSVQKQDRVQKNDRGGDRNTEKFGIRVGGNEAHNVKRENSSSHRKVDRAPDVRVERRIVRQGWSRDRKHAFYGAYLLGIPMGYAAYASHPCYAWLVGPQGPGYYWNYDRCPV